MSKDDRARRQAEANLSTIAGFINALEEVESDAEREKIRAEIEEFPLEVLIRPNWRNPGHDEGSVDVSYVILLCTGGPAARIRGDLDEWFQPCTAKLEYQDWFTPWTILPLGEADERVLVAFAQNFYFGEG